MNEAIQLAIEKGGYKAYGKPFCVECGNYQALTEGVACSCILLDSLFWQALGKALGWPDEGCNHCGSKYLCQTATGFEKAWKFHWHRFIDHIAGGKDPDEFFKELTKERE